MCHSCLHKLHMLRREKVVHARKEEGERVIKVTHGEGKKQGGGHQ